jgi:membrane fusion protein, multidrug efflux system
MKRAFLLLMSLLYLSVAGCSTGGSAASPAERKSARPPVAVDVAVAESSKFVEGINVTGTLAPKFEVDVKSEIMGIVKDVHVNEWIRVKKGTVLARIDSRELDSSAKRAEAALESAKASHLQSRAGDNRANRELDRMKKLREFGLATQQHLDDAGTEAEASVARVNAARAQVRAAQEDYRQARTRLSKGVITAPIDGVVSMRRVNVGDLVGEMGIDRPLFHIVDSRILNLTVAVPSIDMAGVRVGQELHFTTDAHPGRTFIGKVMFINPSVNETDRALKIIAEVDNSAEELKGGLFVKGRIIVGERDNVVQVPRTALMAWDVKGRKAKIFVVSGDTAGLREVTTGALAGDKVEIVDGLKKGESFILKGGFNVRDGDRLILAGRQGG